jgi:hypothetical protein
MKRVRVKIPTKSEDLLSLAGKIKAQHIKLGKTSPLRDVDWGTFGRSIDHATDFNAQADKAHRQGEKFTEQRDKLMSDVADCVRSCRDVLLGLNRRNPRALADFEFVVNETVVTKKKNGNGNGSSQSKD